MRPAIEWAVCEGDGRVVADVLAKIAHLGAETRGRVFLNGRRALPDDPVEPGDRVELWPERDANGDGVRVLAQRDGVVLAFKPAGLPSEPTHQGESAVVTVLRDLLGGGAVHAASRLDVGVSGVMVCCLGGDAARRIERHRTAGQLSRVYLAIGAGAPAPSEGVWEASLARTRDRAGRPLSVPKEDGKPARTRYRTLAATGVASLLELTPATGRMHQLRAHAAAAGCPLFGDRRYGGPPHIVDTHGTVHALDRLALHCWRVTMPGLDAEAPPESMRPLWIWCGGTAEDVP